MKAPTNNLQEVLLTIIEQGEVSIMDFPYLSGFRTRVSELVLEHGLAICSEQRKGTNKFGRTFTYAVHSALIPEQAIELYNKLKEYENKH